MKYQTKLILGYVIVALFFSLIFGTILYEISLGYEKKRQEKSLEVTSDQLMLQMEERLKKMDAIIYYILSDRDMLDSIETLGMASLNKNIPRDYELNAKATLKTGINTEYILQNSYHTLFYNQGGDLISSYNQNDDRSLNGKIDIHDIPYIKIAENGRGKTVMFGAHEGVGSKNEGIKVYSVMKALQGAAMGYIEVENTIDSLDTLETANPDAAFVILTNGKELLYNSTKRIFSKEELKKCEALEEKKVYRMLDACWAKRSSDRFGFSIVAYIPLEKIESGKGAVLLTAVVAAVVSFSLCFLMLLLFSFALSRPVRRLRKVIDKTSLDNLGVQSIENGYKLDEVQRLVESYRNMTERLRQAVMNEKRSLTLQLQAQFDTLQAQINPHFLYNALNIISSRGVEDEDDLICEMCGALANLLRYSTNNKERQASVQQELQYLNSYIFLLQARYGEKICFDILVEEGIYERILPKMTLYQFVENIFEHGYQQLATQIEVKIVGRMYEDHWEISICDNGTGIEENTLRKIKERIQEIKNQLLYHQSNIELEIGGMGLVNTYARCFLMYGEKLIFSIENLEKGVKVVVGEKYIGECENV